MRRLYIASGHDESRKRWTAKRRVALIGEILRGDTSVAEAARKHGLTVADVEDWRERFLMGAEHALRSRPADEDGQKEREIKRLKQEGGRDMTLQRMDNVLIVVDDLEAAKAFFVELGMELEDETTVEGPSVDRLIGLQNVRATLALMRTPDGHGRIELDKFHTPEAIRTGPENVPVNALGIRRIMFAVADIDDVIARLRAHGAELVGEVVQYEDTYRLCYVRGPEGIIVGLAEQLG